MPADSTNTSVAGRSLLCASVLVLCLLAGCTSKPDRPTRALVIKTTNYSTGEPLPRVKIEKVRHERIGWTLMHKRIVDEVKTTGEEGEVTFQRVCPRHRFVAIKRGYQDTFILRPAFLEGRFAASITPTGIPPVRYFPEDDGRVVAPLVSKTDWE